MDVGMDNYYILLELSFDPPVSDPAQIKAALHRKKQEWTRWQDNPGKRGLGMKYLDLADDIQRVMLDSALRAAQAEQAGELRREALRQMEAELRVLEAKGHLLPKEAAAMAVKYKVFGVDKKTVSSLARCPVSDEPPLQPASEDPGEILDPMTARTVARGLEVLDTPDLYAFLEEQPYSSIKKLLSAAEAKRRAAQQSAAKNARSTAMQELAGICMHVFENFDAKQRYDRYLKVSKYPALGQLISEEAARSGYISPDVLLRLVNFGVESSALSVLDAEDFIRRYCLAYSIPLNTQSQTMPCPLCGTKTARGGAVCTSCGAPLRGECPECGADFEGGAPVCAACGFALAEMGKALRYINDAQNALIESNWGTAQRNVQYAKKYWPGHPRIEPLEKRARNLEERYARYIDNIDDCVRHNQYYAALELVNEAQARRIRLPANIVEHVQRVIAELEGRIAALTRDTDTPPIEEVLELAATVGDSIELTRMMKKHPPEPPRALRAQLAGNAVRLSWELSPSPGLVSYVLVRKSNGLALTAFDGDILYEGPAASFEDRSALPLTNYCYSVFTSRSGAFSAQSASAGPVMVIPEIQGLRIVPMDQGVRLSWDVNPAIREVVIWRKLGGERPVRAGEGYRLENNRVDGFIDVKIKNDVDYWYYLVAVYAVDGQEVCSQGICESVTPHKFLAPVDQLAITHSDSGDDCYVVSWTAAANSDILLLASPKLPEHKPGEVVPVPELLARYRRLDLEMRGADSALFQLVFHGGVHVFAAALFGKFASVGQAFYLTNVRNVENPTWDVIGGDLYLNMKWPAGLQEVAVAYRYDRAPESPDEAGTTVQYTTREQYDFDAAVILHEPEAAVYYVKIYSVFRAPDGTAMFSDGVELTIQNVVRQELFYRFQSKKKLFGADNVMALTLTSSKPFLLPKAVLVGKIGRIPLGKADGMPLFEIDKETKVDGELVYQFEIAALPKNLYVRLFLRDDERYQAFHLLPQTSAKIT